MAETLEEKASGAQSLSDNSIEVLSRFKKIRERMIYEDLPKIGVGTFGIFVGSAFYSGDSTNELIARGIIVAAGFIASFRGIYLLGTHNSELDQLKNSSDYKTAVAEKSALEAGLQIQAAEGSETYFNPRNK
ncbi:MAG: hypothetical protein AABX51_08435 [Nanoarchaeota archaeon]